MYVSSNLIDSAQGIDKKTKKSYIFCDQGNIDWKNFSLYVRIKYGQNEQNPAALKN